MAGTPLLTGSDSTGIPREHGILTVIEVARELRCSKSHVHHLIEGRVRGVQPLPSLWLGRRRLVRRSSLNEWIKANEHGAMV
jgi:excisionase family DNA binding protein